MSKLNESCYLVNLNITEEDCTKNLEGIYLASTPQSAAFSALFGECHNIDDDTEEEFDRQISSAAYNGGDVEDDIFTYNVESVHKFDIVKTILNNKEVNLAVPASYTEDSTAPDNSGLYLVDIKWGVYSYDKNLAPVLWATDEDDALLQALLSQSVELADEDMDDEDDRAYYAKLRSELAAKIKASDEYEFSDSSGLYVARSATKLQAITFTDKGHEYTGFINPNDNEEIVRVYKTSLKK